MFRNSSIMTTTDCFDLVTAVTTHGEGNDVQVELRIGATPATAGQT